MTDPAARMEAKLRVAGTLLLCGLLVILGTLVWTSPLSFLMFAGIGGLFVFAGIALYLYSLVSLHPH